MNVCDVVQLWESVGWKNAKDYHNSLFLEPPIIDSLHPDKINPKTFWEAADKHFYTDPVVNSYEFASSFDVEQGNLQNHLISLHMGMIGQTDLAKFFAISKFGVANFAEIGCGYGSFYEHYIKQQTNVTYVGFDLIRRFEEVIETEGAHGTFSELQVEQYKEQFNIFYSANVFQHLSPTQIELYLKQIYKILPYGGYANIMYVYGIDKTYHYGQELEVIPEDQFLLLANSVGYNLIASTKANIGSLKPFSVLLEK